MIHIERRPAWFTEGLCFGRQELTDLFFPLNDEGACGEARQYCERCPVRKDCLDYALKNNIQFGMWGGLTPRERVRYAKNPKAFVMRLSTCEECGTPLKGNQRYYCSQRCVRMGASRRKRDNATLFLVCQVCGNEFSARNCNQKCCGPECRKTWIDQSHKKYRSQRQKGAA